MTQDFNNSLALILHDTTVDAAGAGATQAQSAFTLRTGDTVMVLSWNAKEEFLADYNKRRRYGYATPPVGIAKVIPAISSESGRICYVNHADLFVFTDDFKEKLKDKKFCITGELSLLRETYISLIELCGGEYKKQVTKDLNYLITARTDTVKAQKAKQNPLCRCITEQQFLREILGVKNLSSSFK